MRDILEAATVFAIGIFIGIPIVAVLVGGLFRFSLWVFNYGNPFFNWAAP